MKICLIIALLCAVVFTTQAQTHSPTLSLQTVNAPELSDYLTRLAKRVVARTNGTYTVVVLDDKSINAFAERSGELYLTRGLINATANEAELAFVIAQQLSYLQPRLSASYPRPDLKKPGIAHTLVIGLISGAVIVTGGPVGAKVGALIIAQEMRHRSYPRPVYSSIQAASPTLIFDADKFAVDALHEAGYDPDAALSLLETLRRLRPKNYVEQSQLPVPPVTFLERMRMLRHHLARRERKDEYLLDSSTFQALKKRFLMK